MTQTIKKLLILTSGGDAPGMNACIRAAVRTAIYHGIDIYGAENGYYGLIQRKVRQLDAASVGNCLQRGGTILKTGRCQEFFDQENRARCIEFLQQQQFDGLVVLGGDGSFRGASLLSSEGGPKVVGIPCTIDNDINGTDYCIGFDTACNTALNAIDRIRDTAFSHDRNFIVEVMGRASGFIAAEVGIAGGAEIILTPEFPLSMHELVQKLQQQSRRKVTSIIVAAESSQPGRSLEIARQIQELSGLQYRVCILGHTQRGGTPTVRDRKIAAMMGAKAIEALRKGLDCHMVTMANTKVDLAHFPDPDKATRYLSDQSLLLMNEMICGIEHLGSYEHES